ncbi:glycosyltransferase [Rurimicrobium arvi]|uniref:glycosyltransferase n=1 Tax=Rurimicrobium arvi TaxID=2049916 RepID=UPI0031E25B80
METKSTLLNGLPIPKVSVIVPVYNSEQFINKCVDSLLNQTLSEIEIILVDDASTDNSLEIIKTYERAYPDKIRVLHLSVNQRQGGARNNGIKIATGEYLGFVDSDDWAEATMYEDLYNEARKADSDICYCMRQQVFENGSITSDSTTYFLPTGAISEKSRKEMLVNHVTFIQRYIYKRSLFRENNILFPIKLRYEDMMIDPLIIPYVNHIAAVKKPLFNYFIRSNSTTTEVTDTKYLDKVAVCQMIIDEYKQRGLYERYKDEVDYLYFRKGYVHAALNYIINSSAPGNKVLSALKNDLLKVDPHYRGNPYYRSKKTFMVIDRILDNFLLTKLLKGVLKITKFNI